MSRYFLVAMVAAILSCGGSGDTVSTNDTFVSEDSSLGDNQKPDNFIPPDNQPDTVTLDDINIEAEEGEVEAPCEGEGWFTGDFSCCNPSFTTCGTESCELSNQCQASCDEILKNVPLNPPPDWLELKPPNQFIRHFSDGDIVICTK